MHPVNDSANVLMKPNECTLFIGKAFIQNIKWMSCVQNQLYRQHLWHAVCSNDIFICQFVETRNNHVNGNSLTMGQVYGAAGLKLKLSLPSAEVATAEWSAQPIRHMFYTGCPSCRNPALTVQLMQTHGLKLKPFKSVTWNKRNFN